MIHVYTPTGTPTLRGSIDGLLEGHGWPIERMDRSQHGVDTWTPVSYSSGEWHNGVDLARLRLPLSHPGARYRAACWLDEGKRCDLCPGGSGFRTDCPGDDDGPFRCTRCAGTRWIRKPAPCWHFLVPGPSPLLEWIATACLHASVRRVAAGKKPVLNVVEWRHDFDVKCPRPPCWDGLYVVGTPSTWAGGVMVTNGNYRAPAEMTAFSEGYAIFDGDELRIDVPGEEAM